MTPLALATALLQAAVPTQPAPVVAATAAVAAAPFAVGERLQYSAKLGILKMGTATLTVPRLDTVRGRETYVLEFRLTAKSPFYDVDDRLTSYSTTSDFESLRFHQDFSKDDDRTFDIFPDSGYYLQAGRDERESTPEHPVDDTSFFYFLRLAPLEVGKTYTYRNYFKDEKNPVTVKVLKRETMEMPSGEKVPVLVLHPIIDEGKGLLSKKSDTRIWITDDARRIPLQIRGKFPFGTVTLKLEQMELPGVQTTAGR
ncbi:MAG: DUF3108 domain-containing protein [Gemmatimonadota bacterium]|jgi:hypothetical protein|nr:DUF3108 domain-containing protein [Gemmatimonadota bacterium]